MKQKRYRALCVLLSTLLLASGTLTGCGSGQASGVSKETQTEKMTMLKIPVIVDRSKDEKGKQAKQEWEKVYEVLLGCQSM